MLDDPSMSTLPSIWASVFSWFTPTVLFVFLNLMIGTIAIISGLGSNKSAGGSSSEQQQEPRLLDRSPSVLQRLKSINLSFNRSQEPITATTFEQPLYADSASHHFSFYHQQQTPEQDQKHQPFTLSRSPSVLQRLKSFNLYSYLSQEPSSSSPFTPPTTLLRTHHYSPQQINEQERQQEPEKEEELEAEEVEEEEGEEEEILDQEQTFDEIYSRLKDHHVTSTKSDTKPASGEIPRKLPRKMRKSSSAKSAFSHSKEDDIVEARRPATVREGKAAKAAEEVDDEVDAKADDFINKFKQQLKLQRIDSIIRNKKMVTIGSEQ